MHSQETTDHGGQPFVADIEALTTNNQTFRTAVWTGAYLQMTLMSIEPGGEVGLEVHDDHDQFLRIESGSATVVMGPAKDDLPLQADAGVDFAILVPAGTWHNIINEGDEPLKLYSIYAPGEHPFGTVHATAAEAQAAEGHDQ
ncbi:cupin domain-containing protein [Candidatus Saccharibacteria bacterium]|nr:cupin domain-containing protein [Candidatus Saccharibacteria bacterium]